MLVLTEGEVRQLLAMDECIRVLEQAYRDLGEAQAVNRPRTDCYSPDAQGGYYLLKSMDGILPRSHVAAVRINSNKVAWREYAGTTVKVGVNSKYIGLVILFDTTTGEPLALFPDEAIQAARVGATTGLALKYLANPSAKVAAIIGSGRQAASALYALVTVWHPQTIQVFSPNPSHRAAFAAQFAREGLPVRPCETLDQAAANADIIMFCTNSVKPICCPEWVKPGRFISCVKYAELGDAVRHAADLLVVNSRSGDPINYLPGREPFSGHDPIEILESSAAGICSTGSSTVLAGDTSWAQACPELAEIVAGVVPYSPDDSKSVVFVNNIGLGIQFAAVGALLYERATKCGLGKLVQLWDTKSGSDQQTSHRSPYHGNQPRT